MKKPFTYSLYLLFILLLATNSSCTKLCDRGYEGKRCDIPVREKFIGVWNATDNPGGLTYTDTISAATDIQSVFISNNFALGYFSKPLKATVNENEITISKQNPDGDSLFVEGTGTISNSTINWSYTITDYIDTPYVVTDYSGVWVK